MNVRAAAERALGVALLIGAWALAAAWMARPTVLPSPAAVADTLLASRVALLDAAGRSLARVGAGWLAAVAVGVPLGWGMGAVPALDRELRAVIGALRPIPPFAWLPLLLVWVGIGETTARVVCFTAAAFPVAAYARAGVADTPPALMQAARNLGIDGAALVWRVRVPAALPMTLTGLRSGWTLAWMSVVAAELVGADGGLGQLILDARNLARPDIALAGMTVIGAIAAGSAAGMDRLARRVPGCA